eukprot:664353-Prorocentrum_minimum.AAC.1
MHDADASSPSSVRPTVSSNLGRPADRAPRSARAACASGPSSGGGGTHSARAPRVPTWCASLSASSKVRVSPPPLGASGCRVGLDMDTVELTIKTLSSHLITRKFNSPPILYGRHMSVSSPSAERRSCSSRNRPTSELRKIRRSRNVGEP